jgi:Homeodomain-like domain
MYDTQTRSQFIDLRARGWSYRKIAQHTGISKTTLLRWGQEYQADIERLKHDYLVPFSNGAPPEAAEGPAQESYFHNLEGFPSHDLTVSRSPSRLSRFKRSLRRLARSPLVQAAIRYAIFKR